MTITKLPSIGSRWRWHNRQSTRVYTIIDIFVDDNFGGLQVRYRSDDMAENEYRERSLESFYATTKEGLPRFTPTKQVN